MTRTVALAAVVALVCLSAAPSAQNAADLILHGGKVVTVDAGFTVTEAVAVRGGRIVAVGPNAEILAQRGPQTQMIDLQGRTVLPGLTDAHVHPLGAALSELTYPFAVLKSFDEVRAYIREQAKKTPKGQWIHVPKTFPARLEEMQMPTREVLDATLDHPVFYDASYASAVNSYALRISRINKETPDPKEEGARIVRDKNGEPTGILTGRATSLLKDRPRERAFTDQEKLEALEQMLKRYVAAGLTSIGDRGVSAEAYALYNELKAQQKLPLRITMTGRLQLREIPTSDWVTGRGDEWLKFGSFKVGLDGGMNAGTAKMKEPYGPYSAQLFGIDEPHNDGDLRMTPEELMTIMRAARDKGWQLSAHSQGSGAVEALLHVFETLNTDKPIAPSRSHFIHASFLTKDLIDRAKKIGAIFDVQPDWFHFDGLALSKVTSPEAMRYFVPLKTLADEGIVFAGGSDHMVGWDKNTAINAYNPFLGMWIAISRQTTQGVVIHPEQRLNREQALRMYSSWAAYLQHAEKDRGSIEAGKLADFVVLDRDYLTCPEAEIRSIDPVMTIVAGRVAYSR
jgi:predicted amidohydrolase YtcJ